MGIGLENTAAGLSSVPDTVTAHWTADAVNVLVFKSRSAMADGAATDIAARIKEVAAAKKTVRMIFAAAPSQADVLSALIEIPDIPWAQVTAFHMDDYLELPDDAPQRFGNWLERHLFSKVPLGAVHRIATQGAPDDICRSYSAQLSEAPIDIVCLGIGVNGHIAFNDPPVADFNDPELVKVVELDEVCRQQQVDDECFDALADVPSHAVTLTIPQLMAGEALFCVVPSARKRDAVRAALEGPISTSCPASILRRHKNCVLYLDPEANPNG